MDDPVKKQLGEDLLKASRSGDLSKVKELLSAGAVTSCKDAKDGKTAMDIATSDEIREIIKAHSAAEAAQTTDGAISDHSQTEGPVPEINFSDLEFGEQLGEGAFGVVHRGHWKSRDVAVAIKRVAGKINKTEIEILNDLNHPNIIHFYGVVVVDRLGTPEHYIITELAEGGSLYDLLHRKNYRPSQEESLRWAAEIAKGMEYLHQEKMIHRDLKSSNVLLTGEGNIKICDFGCAEYFDHTTKQTQTGTYRWMAPEVMKGEPVSLSSDVFSYGMLFYEILTCKLPFPDAKTDVVVGCKVMRGEVPPIPDSIDSYLAEILKQCWNANPKARPSFPDILEILTSRGLVDEEIDFDEGLVWLGTTEPASYEERPSSVGGGGSAGRSSGGSSAGGTGGGGGSAGCSDGGGSAGHSAGGSSTGGDGGGSSVGHSSGGSSAGGIDLVTKPPTLDELTDHVKTTEWFKLGLKLGMEEFDLDVIRKNNPQNTEGALEAMLKKWLSITEVPTWRAVVDALRAIKNIQLAKNLETQFCSERSKRSSDRSAILASKRPKLVPQPGSFDYMQMMYGLVP